MTIKNDTRTAWEAFRDYRTAVDEHNTNAEDWTNAIERIYEKVAESASEIMTAHSVLDEAQADLTTGIDRVIHRFAEFFPVTFPVARRGMLDLDSFLAGLSAMDRNSTRYIVLYKLMTEGCDADPTLVETARIIDALEAVNAFGMYRLDDGSNAEEPDGSDVQTVDVAAGEGEVFDSDVGEALDIFERYVLRREQQRAERIAAECAHPEVVAPVEPPAPPAPEVVAPDPNVLPERVRLVAALVELKAIHATTPDPRTDAALRGAMMLLESALA